MVVLSLLAGGGYGWFRSQYPFGWTHVCEIQLFDALMRYADEHNGAFPTGPATPEACLALLHQPPYDVNAHLLSGKSIDTETAAVALINTGTLSPKSCGWHYVPGLRQADSPELALFWDKVGLNHNGGKLSGGGHIVWFIDGTHRHIPAAEWDSFITAQQELRRNVSRE